MEMTQYQKDFVRMLDSMRDTCKGKITCAGIEMKECKECPLTKFCENDIWFNAEKIIEVVTEWAKDHPIVTMRDKYKEVFGIEPKYLCPRYLGFNEVKCESGAYCAYCKDKFWNSEYREPKKESES